MDNIDIYGRWVGMMARCYSPKCSSYKRYGARGITVCDEWKNDYHTFIQWSLSHGFSPKLTIDRKENNKGYSPDNCRWVTVKVNNRNRTVVKLSEEKANEIRTIYKDYNSKLLSEMYGVHTVTINQIKRGAMWK